MSVEQIGVHNQGNWSAGKCGGCVVSDQAGGGVPGSDEVEYYGGYLICESIGRSNIPIVSAAPNMLKALVAACNFFNVPVLMSKAALLVLIKEAIAAATTPIPPVQSQPVPEPVVKYEDIDQHDIFIDGDQYLQYCGNDAVWHDVCSEIGKTKSQSLLHGYHCRRPVKQSPVEPVASAMAVIDVGEGYRKVGDDEDLCACDEYASVGSDGTFRSWQVIHIELGVPKSKSGWHTYLVRRHEFVMPAKPACETKNEKPPLGIVPARLWIEARRDDIYAAIDRYRAAQYVVPAHLLLQLGAIEAFLQDDSDEAQLVIQHPDRIGDS